MANTDYITRLENIINDPNSPPDQVRKAQSEIQRLGSIGSAQVQVSTGGTSSDVDQIKAVFDALTAAMTASTTPIDEKELRKLILAEMAKRKIDESDLSDSLKALMRSNQMVTLTIKQLSGVVTTTTTNADFINRKLIQIILSDMEAKNNVYLYGGAGTGKTFIANEIAELLGWYPITLNCNQYTSPLDIVGGQTTEGYQEGKLIQAWSNKVILSDGTPEEKKGVVLILDELPKIDPNTAGILNEALAKVKQYKINDITGELIPPKIENGKSQKFELGNLLVIATGNVALNTIDPDYEANFKQDLSLQDRFIGSTYKVIIDYDYEFNHVMKGTAFIWLFCVKLREAINDARATNQAFVSMRIMENLRATYKVYRETLYNASPNSAIKKPKTVVDGLITFFDLFKPAPKQAIMNAVNFDAFKMIVEQKNKMPFDPATGMNFDTPSEIAEANKIIEDYNKKNKDII